LKAILACDKNGGIGLNGSMPWPKQKKDLQRFKDLTLNTQILMGRGTWEATGMPKPLPNRTNVVLSRQDLNLPENVEQIKSLSDLNDLAFSINWVIGGAKVFESTFDLLDEIHLTHLYKEYECDTYISIATIKEHFNLASSTICLTHAYEIWKRK